MSIQQNMASDIYRMADSVHRSRDIAAFQQSLAQSIKSGAVESYVGIPVLQSLTQKLKLAQQKEAMAMAAPQDQQQQGVPIAAQVMQDADQYRGIDELSTNLPTEDDDDNNDDDEYANGGIIAFAKEGRVKDPDQYFSKDELEPSYPDTDSVTPYYGLRRNPNSLGLNNRISEFLMTHGDPSVAATPPVTAAPRVVTAPPASTTGSAPRVVSAPPASTTGSASGVEVVEPPVRSGIDNLVAQPPTRLPDTSATPATVERSMYGNMPLMSPEAKEAFSQYAGMYKDMRGDNKKAREEAKYMALLQAGFGMAGGTSPNALANINQGVQPALAQYSAAIKDIRKDDREAVKGLIELGLTKEKFMLEVQKLGIDADKAQKVYDATIKAAQIRAGAVAGGRGLKEVQNLYRIENSELDRIRAEQKKVFEDPAGDYKKAQLDFSLPATPANAEKRAKAQATMDSIYNKTAETIRPYVNRLGAADRALRGDNSDFDPNQYLYPFGKPSTFGKPSSTPKTTNVNPAQFDRG